MFEKFIIYAEKNEDNPGYRYELGQYGFMDDTLKDVSTVLGHLSFYVILTEYEKRKRTNRFSTTIYYYNGDDCIYLEGTSSKKIVYEVYEDEDCNKLIESRTISGEEFAELAKEIIRTKKNAYESVRRPSDRMINEEGMDYDIYVVPEWTIPYLFNDDPSGLEEDEIEAVDKFVESIPNTVFSVVEDDNGEFYKFFSRINDLPGEHGRLGNTCVELKVVRV